jgi:PKD repeat protein
MCSHFIPNGLVHRLIAAVKRLLIFLCLLLSLNATAAVPVVPAFGSIALRTSACTAPCAVFFDASGTTDADTATPFHELQYSWNFGDENAGNYTYGANANRPKNSASGPMASHVYETAGTYTVTLQVSDGTNIVSRTGTVTVTAADTTWAGTATVCASNSGSPDWAGCPAGAIKIANSTNFSSLCSTYSTATRRILLQRGGTWRVPTQCSIETAGTTGMIGAFGSGAKPKILNDITDGTPAISISGVNSPTFSDWRLVDLSISGKGMPNTNTINIAGGASRLTFLRLEIRDTHTGFTAGGLMDYLNAENVTTATAAVPAGSTRIPVTNSAGIKVGQAIRITQSNGAYFRSTVTQVSPLAFADPMTGPGAGTGTSVYTWNDAGAPNKVQWWEQFSFRDCWFEKIIGDNGGYPIYISFMRRFAVQDSRLGDSLLGEHNLRIQSGQKFVVSNNTVGPSGPAKMALTVRGPDFIGSPGAGTGAYTEQGLISDNLFIGSSKLTVSNGSSNPYQEQRQRDEIWERNVFQNAPSTVQAMSINASTRITIRNNVFNPARVATAYFYALVIDPQTPVPPIANASSFIWIYNNTFFSNGGERGYAAVALSQGTTSSNVVVRDNLSYAPADAKHAFLTDGPGSSGRTADLVQSNNITTRWAGVPLPSWAIWVLAIALGCIAARNGRVPARRSQAPFQSS